MRKAILYILYIFFFALASCEKSGIDDCLQSTGKIISEDRLVGNDIRHIYLNNNVNLILAQSNTCRLSVEAGENLMGEIITESDGDTLRIKNTNKCNWIRSYEHDITVYLSLKHLEGLYYNSSGDIISTNTLQCDSLSVQAWDGSGLISLDIESNKSLLSLHYGSVDFQVKGYSKVNYIYAASYGPFYCEDLETEFTFMNNRGSNDCYVYCKQRLEVEIEYVGDIYYRGDPPVIIENISGSGKLIKMD